MSRKYIDDHVEFRPNSISDLPTQSNQYYDPGHLFLEPVGGKRFVNEGANDRNSSLFVNEQYNALILFEQFLLLPAIGPDAAYTKNTNILASGTNAVSAGVTRVANGGGILLTTTTAANDQVILNGISTSVWGSTFVPTNQIVFEASIATGTSIANIAVWAGLKLTTTSVTATDDDQTFFRYQDGVNSGNWQIIDSTAGTDNAQDSGVTVAASTTYFLQVKVGADLAPRYFINGVHVGTGLALTSAAAFKPVIGVQTTTTAAKTLVVRNERLVMPIAPIAS